MARLDDLERRILLKMLSDPSAEELALKYYALEALKKLKEALSDELDDAC